MTEFASVAGPNFIADHAVNTAMKVGFFGDSYIDRFSPWTQYIRELMPDHEFDVTGKGGSNLYYAIHQWRDREHMHGPDHYDVAVFTLTWPERLFSVWPYRNEQFCARSEFRTWEPDCEIKDDRSNQEFLDTIPRYYQYIHDSDWREFDWELEIKWIMDLARPNRHTKFVIIPNTKQSLQIARRYHQHGVLMDMAFESISNQEPGSPGPMPVCDMGRLYHLNDHNHRAWASVMAEVIAQAPYTDSRVWPVDFDRFDLVR